MRGHRGILPEVQSHAELEAEMSALSDRAPRKF